MLKRVAGRQVPFTPRQFPIRLSRRVGLRHMQSIGAKKPLVCPSGEQIVNGGFETGDFTGWTHSDYVAVITYCVDGPHTGVYNVGRTEYVVVWVEQTLLNPVSAECFKPASKFSFWFYFSGYPGEAYVKFYIKYTDGTQTEVTHYADDSEADNWAEVDLKPYVEAAKTVKALRIEFEYGCLDDVTCSV